MLLDTLLFFIPRFKTTVFEVTTSKSLEGCHVLSGQAIPSGSVLNQEKTYIRVSYLRFLGTYLNKTVSIREPFQTCFRRL